MPLTRYAEVLAHVAHFGGGHAAEVRARMKVSERVWHAADDHWTAVLATDARTPGATTAVEFARSFQSVVDRLAEDQPGLSSLGSLPTEGEGAVDDTLSMDTTAAVAAVSDADAALPFSGTRQAPEKAADALAEEATELAGETLFVGALTDEALSAHDAAAARSEAAAATVEAPRLSLEQYASLTVDLERTDDRTMVLKRYGLEGEAALANEHQRWQARLPGPDGQAKLRSAMDAYRGWISRR